MAPDHAHRVHLVGGGASLHEVDGRQRGTSTGKRTGDACVCSCRRECGTAVAAARSPSTAAARAIMSNAAGGAGARP